MGQTYWRIATRSRRAADSAGWDIGRTAMPKAIALAKVVDFNARYPAYQHKAVAVPGRREHRRKERSLTTPLTGGTPREVHPRSPDQAVQGRRGWIVL